MAAKEFKPADAESANINLLSGGRGTQAVHDVVTAMRANRRQGNASTKTRSEVADSGKKPFRQKGTGRARQGGNASPIHRGGGIAHGPRPRDFSKNVNRKTRRLAFRKALTGRIEAGDVLAADSLKIEDGKTKSFLAALGDLGDARNLLVIGSSFDELTCRAARNVARVQLATAAEVNTEQLLHYEKVLITGDALETLAQRTA